jgi:putative transposase
LLDNNQRMRLATKARKLTRKLLEETTILFSPETILGWFRKCIAQKYDGSANRGKVGRPEKENGIVHWILKIKEENLQWGSRKICDCLVNLGFEVYRITVWNVLLNHGYDPEPSAKSISRRFPLRFSDPSILGQILNVSGRSGPHSR